MASTYPSSNPMTFNDILINLFQRQNLSTEQMQFAMQKIMGGEVNDVQIASFLAALATKGETLEEIIGAVEVMRGLSTKVIYPNPQNLLDTVGCGDGSSTFNISTCCALIAAAAGVPVAKHGNRSNTSASGSSDVLAEAGVNLELTAHQVSQCIQQIGIGFLYAPKHHAAMRHAVSARKAMQVRTLFNLLGPLTNPAQAQRQVIGLFSEQWLEMVAKVLAELGSHHAMILHAKDHIDEISIAAVTDVVELRDGKIHRWQINPTEYGIQHDNLNDLIIDSPQQSLSMIKEVLAGDSTNAAATDIVILNAAASLYVGGACDQYADGIDMAKEVIQSTRALDKLNELVSFSQSFANAG